VRTERLDDGVVRSEGPNGLIVVTETMPALRSAAAGFWIRAASAHETPDKMGVSHLLEHMVFKGTERRSAQDIALALEFRGGALDAYTGRDHTTFQARVLDSDLPLAVEVLTDLIRRRDSPTRTSPRSARSSSRRSPWSRTIRTTWSSTCTPAPCGRATATATGSWAPATPWARSRPQTCGGCTIWRITRARRCSRPRAAWTTTRCCACSRAKGWFRLESGPEAARVPDPGPGVRGEHHVERDSAQVHLVLGTETFRFADRRRHALSLLTTTFGGGMSSRLFQKVREDLGLAYTVYAFNSFHQASGMAGVYVGPGARRRSARSR